MLHVARDASQQNVSAIGRYGSNSEVAAFRREVCLASVSGHWTDIPGGPFCAIADIHMDAIPFASAR